MKTILFLFITSMHTFVYGQNVREIQLTTPKDGAKLGLWEVSNYKVYVDMNVIETNLYEIYKSYANPKQIITDSTTASIMRVTSNRYLKAVETLQKAQADFNLKRLSLYYGPENEIANRESSYIIESYVINAIDSGNAIIYYKDKQIHTIINQQISDSPDKDYTFGYDVVYFYDDINTYAFKYHRHIGW